MGCILALSLISQPCHYLLICFIMSREQSLCCSQQSAKQRAGAHIFIASRPKAEENITFFILLKEH